MTIVIFFLVYTASALAAGGKLFNSVFGVDYHIALTIGAFVILAYTFMGGFLAVCTTDFIQGTLMLVALLAVPIVAGLFLCGILAAIMSTADSQLLVSASSVAEDIYKGVLKKDVDDNKVLKISRITVLVIAVLAYVIALDPNSSIMGLVSNAWAGLGAAFGPIVVLSLFWKRTNLQGAIAGIASGALAVIVWDYIPFANGQTLGSATGLYSLVIGFVLSMLMILAVSLVTPAPSEEILTEFNDVKNGTMENL